MNIFSKIKQSLFPDKKITPDNNPTPSSPNKILDYRHPLENGQPPVWAQGWGQDEYGVFAEICVQQVVQRMRWIPPGIFMMGSPDSEAGRYDDEGPQHAVTLTTGYWLFDTPVTQALWQVVMGENPSRFVSPQRPVEEVNWHDAQAFITTLNGLIPQLRLTLPTEAQWEHACRATSETATYHGEMAIKGECDAPVLDEIAWYSGNSGVDFDLPRGYGSSDWREKQYPHNRAGTRCVALKRPNDWGLYDMLGNVSEWCHDGQRSYDKSAVVNPVGSEESGAARVLRGGSWSYSARNVRAADRNAYDPGYRSDYFGFRCCARV
jgi:formylglycine-generating enzyme required for sulfatase activity